MRNNIKVLALICILFLTESIVAQVKISTKSEESVLKKIPLETIYIHANRGNYFPGEYIYFSLFCVNMQNYRLSEISKVAYVKLVNELGDEVSSQKIRLNDGKGQGDIFLETTIESGPYKLYAFTNWMKNAPENQVFSVDIAIINPYKNDQATILGDSTSINNSFLEIENDRTYLSSLSFQFGKDNYGAREKVSLNLLNNQNTLGYGNYSISVAYVDSIPEAGTSSAVKFAMEYPNLQKQITQTSGEVIAFPEQRGEIISGTITDAKTSEPIKNERVAISLPGEYFQLKSATTYDDGRFYAYATAPYNENTAVLEIISPDDRSFNISTYDPAEYNIKFDEYFRFTIDSSMRETIKNRSIYNQIENSYYEVKPDTILQWQGIDPYNLDPFYGEPPVVYDLDKYTRFNTLNETLVEIVDNVWVRKMDSGDFTFWVRTPLVDVKQGEYTTDPPLVTIDGILIPNHNDLLAFNARRLKSIKVLRHAYVLDGKDYQGMVALETIDGNYLEEWNSPAGKKVTYQAPAMEKRYFSQGVSLAGNIPDYRYQLLWIPHFKLESNKKQFDFYTSEVKGTYRIRLEGFTEYGKPISLIDYLTVD